MAANSDVAKVLDEREEILYAQHLQKSILQCGSPSLYGVTIRASAYVYHARW